MDAKTDNPHSLARYLPGARAVLSRSRSWTALWPNHIPIAVKLGLMITLLIIGGMSSLGLWMIDHQNRVMRAQLHDFGATVAAQLAELVGEPILSEDSLSLGVIAANLARGEKVLGAAIYAHNGDLLAAAGLQPAGGMAQTGFSGSAIEPSASSWSWVSPGDGRIAPERRISFVAASRYKDVVAGYALVTLSTSLMDEALQKARRAILYSTLFMSLLASLAALALSRRISRPIQKLMEATRAISRGDLDVRISDKRKDEIGVLIDSFNHMADGLLTKSRVEQMLSRYVSKNVADRILANLDQIRLGSRHVEATVLFADIVGFTGLAEKLEPSAVSELLNEYFSYISVGCKLYNGVIDKFIGDCAMLVFGAVEDDPEHRFNAIACAVLIQQLSAILNERRQADGLPRIDFRIGINSGRMLAGNLGSDDRMEYTVVGDAVNIASRLASEANAGQVIIREELFMHPGLNSRIVASPHQTIALRGKTLPVTTYNVFDVHSRYHPVLTANLEEVIASRVNPAR